MPGPGRPGLGAGPGRRRGQDWFFIVDGDLTIYLIPSRIIAGRVGILLRTYTRYTVGSAASLMTPSAAVA
jgi:hypothetical protein